jgi:hypothetical protein
VTPDRPQGAQRIDFQTSAVELFHCGPSHEIAKTMWLKLPFGKNALAFRPNCHAVIEICHVQTEPPLPMAEWQTT